jgi:hypothetical protein
MTVNPTYKGLLTPKNCTVIFIDHQPQIFLEKAILTTPGHRANKLKSTEAI